VGGVAGRGGRTATVITNEPCNESATVHHQHLGAPLAPVFPSRRSLAHLTVPLIVQVKAIYNWQPHLIARFTTVYYAVGSMSNTQPVVFFLSFYFHDLLIQNQLHVFLRILLFKFKIYVTLSSLHISLKSKIVLNSGWRMESVVSMAVVWRHMWKRHTRSAQDLY